jgi:hypothetical protein
MMKFVLSDEDFESSSCYVVKSEKRLELRKFGKDEFILFEHIGDNVNEVVSFTKEEWKTLWLMLTIR